MHFQREKVETGLVDITHVTSNDNAADEWSQICEISRATTNTLTITLSDHTTQRQTYGGQTPQTRHSFLSFPRRFVLGFTEARGNRTSDVRLGQGGLAESAGPNAGDDEGERAHELEANRQLRPGGSVRIMT